MEITLEQVEKVRSCTGASYEEAKAALEETGGNVLDAVILLEQRGRTGPAGGDYSTRGHTAPPEPEAQRFRRPSGREVRRAVRDVAAHCLSISLEIWKSGRMTCMIPLLAALALVLLEPGLMGALLALGMCAGYRVHVSGRGTEGWAGRFNQLSDQLGDTMNDAVRQLRGDRRKKDRKK